MEISDSQKVQMLSELAEASRMLASIENISQQQTPFCCMVTSAAWGEGKTTLSCGLGIIAAKRANKNILAIDMNWYSPGLHRYFGLAPEWELGRYSQDNDLNALIRPSGSANLDILTAPVSSGNEGSFNTDYTELAQSILKQARQVYDFVIVDTAAAFPTNRHMVDPVVLGSAVDAVILVVLTGVTPRQQIKRVRVMLESSGAKLAGVVLNHWKNKIQ